MNEELMILIRQKDKNIKDVRHVKEYVEVKLADDERSWIPLWKASIPTEQVIKKWISVGGKIDNQPERLNPEAINQPIGRAV